MQSLSLWGILKTESNRQDANRNSIRICRQIGIGQMYPGRRFALPWAISFCPFGAAGSMVDRVITKAEQRTCSVVRSAVHGLPVY